jgi:uncharacterized Fe-S cluster protein YjdI
MKKEIRYKGKEVTVLWKPDLCIHSGVCVKGLPAVFRPNEKPWVDIHAANSAEIIAQVGKCPSGALSIVSDKDAGASDEGNSDPLIEVSDKGPYIIKGGCVIRDHEGNNFEKSGTVALCRCGLSANKPFCDGSHSRSDWI